MFSDLKLVQAWPRLLFRWCAGSRIAAGIPVVDSVLMAVARREGLRQGQGFVQVDFAQNLDVRSGQS